MFKQFKYILVFSLTLGITSAAEAADSGFVVSIGKGYFVDEQGVVYKAAAHSMGASGCATNANRTCSNNGCREENGICKPTKTIDGVPLDCECMKRSPAPGSNDPGDSLDAILSSGGNS